MKKYERVKALVSLDAIAHNFEEMHRNVKEGTKIIAVIKADTNRMFVYQTHFDFSAMTYQIMNTQVMAYDTKTVLGTSDTPLSIRHYGMASPMKSIVDYIYAFQHGAAN